MSKMALVMNLLLLLFSVSLVRSDKKSTVPLRSFKISENVTYDCIDIYKQPGLDHPLLINHTIQMKPSASRPEIKNTTGTNKTYKLEIECPDGTVPVLRNTNSAQLSAEKYFHVLTQDSHGTHVAGIKSRNGPFYGVQAQFSAYGLNIRKDQASYSEIYVKSGLDQNQANVIAAGMMINPSVFPDGRVWSYGFWKGKDGKGCYNKACPGFVQVSQKVPLVAPIDLKPGELAWSYNSIFQDEKTGNWWILQRNPDVDIGYWPKELFNLLGNSAVAVGVGGVVQASPSGSSPPMGSGKFPHNENKQDSAIFKHIEAFNFRRNPKRMYSFTTDGLCDSNCYRLRVGEQVPEYGSFFNYGGPGGDSCGI